MNTRSTMKTIIPLAVVAILCVSVQSFASNAWVLLEDIVLDPGRPSIASFYETKTACDESQAIHSSDAARNLQNFFKMALIQDQKAYRIMLKHTALTFTCVPIEALPLFLPIKTLINFNDYLDINDRIYTVVLPNGTESVVYPPIVGLDNCLALRERFAKVNSSPSFILHCERDMTPRKKEIPSAHDQP